jgi:hypothetical protein
MMRFALALLLLTPALVLGQLQLSVHETSGDTPVGGVLELGTADVGQVTTTVCRLRNVGVASITLARLFVSGTGFRLTGDPSLPHIVAPGTNVDFSIQFRPTDFGPYTATLNINSASILLRASSNAAALLISGGVQLSSGSSVDFGRLERGQSAKRSFELRNPTTAAVTVSSLRLSGNSFRLMSPLQLPLVLAAGATIGFETLFEPLASGIATGTLEVDRSSVRLTGTSIEPPFPRPALTVDPPVLISGQQARLAVQLAEPSRALAGGTVRIEFEPAEPGTRDGGILFLSNSSRSVSFSVAEGDNAVRFGSEQALVFQTGTTAGTIMFVVEVGGFTERLSVPILPAAVKIDRAFGTREGNNLSVTISGYDNTRTVSALKFTFFDRAGKAVNPGPIPVDSYAAFRRHFEESALGGIFQLRAVFPVAGDVTHIGSVDVELTNASGAVRTERLSF